MNKITRTSNQNFREALVQIRERAFRIAKINCPDTCSEWTHPLCWVARTADAALRATTEPPVVHWQTFQQAVPQKDRFIWWSMDGDTPTMHQVGFAYDFDERDRGEWCYITPPTRTSQPPGDDRLRRLWEWANQKAGGSSVPAVQEAGMEVLRILGAYPHTFAPLTSEPAPAPASEWQPIETAPTDGQSVILGHSTFVTEGFRNHEGEHVCNVIGRPSMPFTHWMRMPSPPLTKSGEQA